MKKLFSILTICCLFLIGQDYIFDKDSLTAPMEDSDISTGNETSSSLQNTLHMEELTMLPSVGLDLIRANKPAYNMQEQIIKSVNRLFESLHIKEQGILYKLSETRSFQQTINYFSLRNRGSHWIYVLRKIVI